MARKRAQVEKPEPTTRVRSGGFVNDPSMSEADKWANDGCGVSEEVKNVGCMPNDDVMHPEDSKHLR